MTEDRSSHFEDTQPVSSVPPIQSLMLALFLVLLAFFIAMTAGAEFEDDKAMPILNNLNKVFPVNELRGQGLPALIDLDTLSRGEGMADENLDGLFNSDAFPFQRRVSRAKGAYIVSLTKREIDELLSLSPETVTTVMQRQTFFGRLAALVQPYGRPGYHMDILVFIPRQPSQLAAEDRARLTQAILKSEIYALSFKKHGIEAARIGAGVRQGNPDIISLVFTARPAEPSK